MTNRLNQVLKIKGSRAVIRLAGYAVVVCVLLFYSCEKAKDITTINVPIRTATIKLNDIVVQDGTRSDGALNYFSASQVIYLNQIEAFTEELLKYLGKISGVEVGTASIIITADDGEGTVVEDFVLEAVGVAELNIPQYELGSDFTEDVQPFAAALLLELVHTNSVEVHITGRTDVTSGKVLKAKIELGDMKFAVDLLTVLE